MKILSYEFDQQDIRRIAYLRRYFFAALGVVLLAAVILFAAVVPAFLGDLDLQQKLQDEKNLLAQLNQKVDSLQQSVYLSNADSVKDVNLALPSEKPLLALLATTNQLAQSSGVTVANVDTSPGKLATTSGKLTAPDTSNPSDPANNPNLPREVRTLNIQVEVRGTLAQINQFIQQMEQATPFVNISQIALSSLAQGANTNASTSQDVFSAKLNLTTYYFAQSVSVLVDAPLPDIGPQEQDLLKNLSSFIFPEVQKQQNIQGGGLQDLFGVNSSGIRTQQP